MKVSFIHSGDLTWASYRYRALWPSVFINDGEPRIFGSVNDWDVDVVVLAKPVPHEVGRAREHQRNGGRVIVDICDDHFGRIEYREAARMADAVTCPTLAMARIIKYYTGCDASVIPEMYELPESPPHCIGNRLLWFGHQSNWHTLERVRPFIAQYPLTTISNHPDATIQWSREAVTQALAEHDIVILPATAPGKSPNRAVEAIRAGCMVVAEPHRSLVGMGGVWMGETIEHGIGTVVAYPSLAETWIRQGQKYVAKQYAPERIGELWRGVIARLTRANET